MKSLTTILLVCAIFAGCTRTPEQTKTFPTATELINKCIAFHDPNNTWGNYTGKVRLVYVSSGFISDEIIEINTATGFHRADQKTNGISITKGIRNDKPFRLINGDSTLTDKEIEQNGLSDSQVRFMQNHHYCHFGQPMQLMNSGAVVSDSVSTTTFNGWNCYVLSFEGKKDSVINPYFEGTTRIYIDQDTFVMRGVELDNNTIKSRQFFIGEINTNGIRMPQIKIYYDATNNTLWGTDIFMPAVSK